MKTANFIFALTVAGLISVVTGPSDKKEEGYYTKWHVVLPDGVIINLPDPKDVPQGASIKIYNSAPGWKVERERGSGVWRDSE
jgi:uncharacterized protein YcnI